MIQTLKSQALTQRKCFFYLYTMLHRTTKQEDLKQCWEVMKKAFPETFTRKMKIMRLDSQHVLTNKEHTYWCILDDRDPFCIKLAYHTKLPTCRQPGIALIRSVINYCKNTFTKGKLVATVRASNVRGRDCLLFNRFHPLFMCKIQQEDAIKYVYFFNPLI